MNSKNKLSILTTHFRDIKGLTETWNSIKSQVSEDWEWIIVNSYTDEFYNKIQKEQ